MKCEEVGNRLLQMKSNCLQYIHVEFSNQHLEIWIWNVGERSGLVSELEIKVRWPQKIRKVGNNKRAKHSAT